MIKTSGGKELMGMVDDEQAVLIYKKWCRVREDSSATDAATDGAITLDSTLVQVVQSICTVQRWYK